LDQAARWSGARTMQAAVHGAYREVFGEAPPKRAPQDRPRVGPTQASVTPVTGSIRNVHTRNLSNRRSRNKPLLALAWVALLALAVVEPRGLATESAMAHPALASAARDDLGAAPLAVRVTGPYEVRGEPLVVAPAPKRTPSRSAAPLLSPATSRRAAPDIKTLFDRRH
jgi:hypothetical protein